MSSIARDGPAEMEIAACRVRTLADGGLTVCSAVHPHTGEWVAVRVGPRGLGAPVTLRPADPHVAGWRLIDVAPGPSDSWVVAELAPGPPDQVVVRQVHGDGSPAWHFAATAGSDDAVDALLGVVDGAVLAAASGRLVRFDDEGAMTAVRALQGVSGAVFMNGHGRAGFVSGTADTVDRGWATVDVRDGVRSDVALDPESAWGLDLPLGLDGDGHPYGNRYGTLVRFGADGRADWELGLGDLTVPGLDLGPPSLEFQTPAGPAVTDAGEVDVVARDPGALYVVRVTPG
jgi:hypothetical protein